MISDATIQHKILKEWRKEGNGTWNPQLEWVTFSLSPVSFIQPVFQTWSHKASHLCSNCHFVRNEESLNLKKWWEMGDKLQPKRIARKIAWIAKKWIITESQVKKNALGPFWGCKTGEKKKKMALEVFGTWESPKISWLWFIFFLRNTLILMIYLRWY